MEAYWGQVCQPGSLCNLKEVINRKKIEKKAKNFSIADEFILHTFKSHIIAAICDIMKLDDPTSSVPHEASLKWLEDTAKHIVTSTITPKASNDAVYAFHRSFLHTTFLYIDLRNAIRYEDGPHIIRHWQQWLVYFLGCNKNNYSTEDM